MQYVVGPRNLRLLQRYRYHFTMLSRFVGYFGTPFKLQSSVIQGVPLSPTIFNVVVDEILQNRVSVGLRGDINGGGVRDRHRGFWTVHPMDGSIFLC